MSMIALFAPPNFIDELLLKFFSAETVNFVVWPFIQIGLVITLIAVWALYASYLERKISAFMQARLGPMRVGKWGLLQPIADAVKLLTKEDLMPEKADPYIFRFAPYIAVAATVLTFAVIPFAPNWGVITDVNIGLLFVLSISSVGVLALILAGWASNSKYAFLGALRSAAQMVSYEVSIGFVLITVLLCVGSLNLSKVVLAQSGWFFNWFWLPLLPMFVIFFVSALAETNRTPFDLPMSEAELVAGFHTEYSAMTFGLFFLGEYANMILLSALGAVLFLGGWMSPIPYPPFTWVPGVAWFALKIAFLLFVFSWTKGTLPRYRYDQLMRLGWKVFLPVSLGWVVLTAAVLQFGGWVPKI